MTSEIAASIAAASTLHLVSQSRERRKIDEERLRLAPGTHRLHLVYGNAARQLGHAAGISEPGAGQPLRPVSKVGQSRAVGPNRTDDHGPGACVAEVLRLP